MFCVFKLALESLLKLLDEQEESKMSRVKVRRVKLERNKLRASLAVWIVFLISVLFGISQTNLDLAKWKRKDQIWIDSEIISSSYK